MHVLIVPSWYPTPDNPINGCFFREQALALKRNGLDIGVIAPIPVSIKKVFQKPGVPFYTKQFEMDNGVPSYRYYYWNIPKIRNFQIMQFISTGITLFEKYTQRFGNPDLIHAHSALYGGYLAQIIKNRTGIPYLVTEHSTAFSRNVLSENMLNLAKKIFLGADTRIFVSPGLANICEEKLKTSLAPWEWVPNMVKKSFFLAPSPKSGPKGEKFVFLNVGFLTPKKGQSDLIHAFAKAFKYNSGHMELRIGGDGPSLQGLYELTEREGISEQVHFLGSLSREQVRDEMANCDAFVLSSHHETFGVVVIEALAMGKPVIATRCGGPEYILNEYNGILVEPKDIDSLSEAMKKIRSEISNYNSKLISQEALSKYGEQRIIHTLKKYYAEIIGNHVDSDNDLKAGK